MNSYLHFLRKMIFSNHVMLLLFFLPVSADDVMCYADKCVMLLLYMEIQCVTCITHKLP